MIAPQSMEDAITSSIACQYPDSLILQDRAILCVFDILFHASKSLPGPAPPSGSWFSEYSLT